MVAVENLKLAIFERENELKEKFGKEKIIERECVQKVKGLVATDVALIISGVRRCGKSILAFSLGNENFGYVNFEDERLEIKSEELNKVLEALYSLKGKMSFFVFDEIQNVSGWEKFVSRICQTNKIIITGSNAKLLSREFATFLTGRHLTFTLFPFSFKEFLDFNEFKPNIYLTKDVATAKKLLEEYLEKGGFPLVYKTGKFFLSELYSDILEKDVLQRHTIKFKKLIKDIAKYLISNFASEISHNKLKNIFQIKSVHTVNQYVEYLSDAFLLFELERFSFKLKDNFKAPKKIYCIDTGLCGYVSFNAIKRTGALMENVVAIELVRRKNYSLKKSEIFYWKDHQQREVDFVVKEENKVTQLIQVTYASEKNEIPPRELTALIKASIELKCDTLLIITWDFEAEEKIENKTIVYVPLWKWLLQ
ncbi:MAG: ATP-binding protein [Candidatus Diapherotrites archaeon]|nr:ATP-binding protein [Candidatus Diapherotrites archaeon]